MASSVLANMATHAPDTFQYLLNGFIDEPTKCSVAQTCTKFHACIRTPDFYKMLFITKSIPFVHRADPKDRDYKQEFRVLYPMMGVTQKDIETKFKVKILGRPSLISEEDFNTLSQPDPFDTTKRINETYLIVSVPQVVGKDLVGTGYVLDDEGALIEEYKAIVYGQPLYDYRRPKEQTSDVREIPFSYRNMHKLCHFKDEIGGRGCSPCGPNNSVLLMRKYIPDSLRNLDCETIVEPRLKKCGFRLIDVQTRVLANLIQYEKQGQCLDQCRVGVLTSETFLRYDGIRKRMKLIAGMIWDGGWGGSMVPGFSINGSDSAEPKEYGPIPCRVISVPQ